MNRAWFGGKGEIDPRYHLHDNSPGLLSSIGLSGFLGGNTQACQATRVANPSRSGNNADS
jgi:hypothetical protein